MARFGARGSLERQIGAGARLLRDSEAVSSPNRPRQWKHEANRPMD